ncbi:MULTISPECIES: RNA polymerase sigma factor SigJ [Ensifer]|jgi:RNA polymerase sigma-70 factor (ECF subfamily)|uniref:Sigma-70 family RNA polymerase sigma factor n=1 Tax=Ensifer canadensis TaxID=555315 RepID=A0AAW4FD45_9HYPH|nr:MULTISPECIES: RNA polymerase sigma factor SigJ [Ensifer]AHK43066.1 RNA polymerase, sigma-24 subunit, ECF subfamily [Ensifer adhaerens OV14]MDP9628828.1 RNA polymerase sigma-70 factor (ECF subfamily) [Ensifer adhaerens]KQU98439.1 RNA polymerase subunit sigma-24 [Ensifer sp. Root31]KQW63198.1 RNA polymerase subunit sigma-24 [Ensifer sp. Root1252]KQW85214.1 RNA polymerase subunit sigma-24 [Ensifer sp. Root127]
MGGANSTAIFEEARPRLLGLAYRILGSRADAEDAVQDTFVKWQEADQLAIESPAAWLTTACTRRCLDLLKAAHRKRVDYVGAWLPEPIHTASDDNAEEKLALTSSLTTAFLLMLERLTPKERAAYLLHEIFGQPYEEVAETLDMQEAAARKLVSRAKTNIGVEKSRHQTPRERQDELLSAFHTAIHGGNIASLSSLLSADVRLTADGGGKVATVLGVLSGKQTVLAFIADRLTEYWAHYVWDVADINGGRGIVLRGETENDIAASVSFGYDGDGNVNDIFIVRNPDKLTHLGDAVVH